MVSSFSAEAIEYAAFWPHAPLGKDAWAVIARCATHSRQRTVRDSLYAMQASSSPDPAPASADPPRCRCGSDSAVWQAYSTTREVMIQLRLGLGLEQTCAGALTLDASHAGMTSIVVCLRVTLFALKPRTIAVQNMTRVKLWSMRWQLHHA